MERGQLIVSKISYIIFVYQNNLYLFLKSKFLNDLKVIEIFLKYIENQLLFFNLLFINFFTLTLSKMKIELILQSITFYCATYNSTL